MNDFVFRSRSSIFSFALLLWSFLPLASFAENVSSQHKKFAWNQIEDGFAIAEYELNEADALLPSSVLLLKISPTKFRFDVVTAAEIGTRASDIKTFTRKETGVAGINANFFDQAGQPLGLIFSRQRFLQKLHQGGSLLTGVFQMQRNRPSIVSRNAFDETDIEIAVQAGPRIIAQGKPLQLRSSFIASRRSGVAITTKGEVVLFATLLRFPGASLAQIQKMLLDPQLQITDALNFDGGGSSQIFVERGMGQKEERFISGGDLIPSGLVVKRKK